MRDDQRAKGMRFCRDCGELRPLSEFYRTKAARYAGGYRYSAYCKAHTNARTARSHRDAPEGSGTREAMRRASREYTRRNPEKNRAKVATYRARKKGQADSET